MSDNEKRDHKYFNCSEDHELRYVSNLYGENSAEVLEFLKASCADNTIHYSTHDEVYQLIKDKLGYEK